MPPLVKIQRRFASLLRCLALEEAPPQFGLEGTVVPVVPVSTCYDQLSFSVGAVASGGQNIGVSPALEAGVYRVDYTVSYYPALAGLNVQFLRVTVAGNVLLTFGVFQFDTNTVNLTGGVTLSLPDQAVISLVANAAGAGNTCTIMAVVQAL